MTGNAKLFSTLSSKEGGFVTFGDNGKGKIIGIGDIGKDPFPIIENVLLVDGLRHNLLSISQLCDKGHRVIFEKSHCIIEDIEEKKTIFVGTRHENVYIIDAHSLSSNDDRCLTAVYENSWLWHKRLAHANMHLISKLSNKDLVIGLPKIKFEKDRLCDACQMGKQTRTSFSSKNIVSTSRPLQLLHMDLF